MKYYEIALLKSSAPALTYASVETLASGTLVSVPLKSTIKDAVVVHEVGRPEFETEEILSVSESYYTSSQMDIAKFISEYYFSSFSEAISLFLPYPVGANPCVRPLDNNTTCRVCIPAHHGGLENPPYIKSILSLFQKYQYYLHSKGNHKGLPLRLNNLR